MISFIAGLILGWGLGALVVALCAVARDADERMGCDD